MSSSTPRVAAFLAAGLLSLTPFAAPAVEIGATHLVFEKSAKMKKIDAALFVSFGADEVPRLRCGVTARGKKGPLEVAGTVRLRLLGESGGEVWRSSALDATVDADGEVLFAAADIEALVAEAAAGGEIRLARIDFAGGRGGRATELTVDCLLERGET